MKFTVGAVLLLAVLTFTHSSSSKVSRVRQLQVLACVFTDMHSTMLSVCSRMIVLAEAPVATSSPLSTNPVVLADLLLQALLMGILV